jgi:hypothetical protein
MEIQPTPIATTDSPANASMQPARDEHDRARREQRETQRAEVNRYSGFRRARRSWRRIENPGA